MKWLLKLFTNSKECPYFGGIMYKQEEIEAPAGSWVVYVQEWPLRAQREGF